MGGERPDAAVRFGPDIGCLGQRLVVADYHAVDHAPPERRYLLSSVGLRKRQSLKTKVSPAKTTSPLISSGCLREKLIKIGAKLVSHGRYVAFQMAEVALPRMLFAEILRLIAELRPPPDPVPA